MNLVVARSATTGEVVYWGQVNDKQERQGLGVLRLAAGAVTYSGPFVGSVPDTRGTGLVGVRTNALLHQERVQGEFRGGGLGKMRVDTSSGYGRLDGDFVEQRQHQIIFFSDGKPLYGQVLSGDDTVTLGPVSEWCELHGTALAFRLCDKTYRTVMYEHGELLLQGPSFKVLHEEMDFLFKTMIPEETRSWQEVEASFGAMPGLLPVRMQGDACLYANLDLYVGEWEAGQRHGVGQCVYDEGNERYDGSWKSDKWVKGVWTKGEWKIDGGFVEDRVPQGLVVVTAPDGTVISGFCDKGLLDKGNVVVTYPDGRKFCGLVDVDDLMSVPVPVHGVEIRPDGSRYQGVFNRGGQRSGEGFLFTSDGRVYHGPFVHDLPEGAAGLEYIRASGILYRVPHVRGVKSGKGVCKTSALVYHVAFEGGKEVSRTPLSLACGAPLQGDLALLQARVRAAGSPPFQDIFREATTTRNRVARVFASIEQGQGVVHVRIHVDAIQSPRKYLVTHWVEGLYGRRKIMESALPKVSVPVTSDARVSMRAGVFIDVQGQECYVQCPHVFRVVGAGPPKPPLSVFTSDRYIVAARLVSMNSALALYLHILQWDLLESIMLWYWRKDLSVHRGAGMTWSARSSPEVPYEIPRLSNHVEYSIVFRLHFKDGGVYPAVLTPAKIPVMLSGKPSPAYPNLQDSKVEEALCLSDKLGTYVVGKMPSV